MSGETIIQELSLEEKITFLQAYVFLIKADGKLEDEEKVMISELVKSYQIEPKYFNEINNLSPKDNLLSKIKSVVADRRHALFFFFLLLSIANIDDDLDDAEINFIETIARLIKVERNKILQINELIMERMAWLAKNDLVMENNLLKGE